MSHLRASAKSRAGRLPSTHDSRRRADIVSRSCPAEALVPCARPPSRPGPPPTLAGRSRRTPRSQEHLRHKHAGTHPEPCTSQQSARPDPGSLIPKDTVLGRKQPRRSRNRQKRNGGESVPHCEQRTDNGRATGERNQVFPGGKCEPSNRQPASRADQISHSYRNQDGRSTDADHVGSSRLRQETRRASAGHRTING